MFRRTKRFPNGPWRGGAAAIALLALLACGQAGPLIAALAQDEAGSAPRPLVVTANFTADQRLAPDSVVELRWNRPLGQSEGRVALFIGQTDVSNLCALSATSLRYEPKLLPLPEGETPLALYLAPPTGQWREVARFPLRVEAAKKATAAAPAKGEGEPTGDPVTGPPADRPAEAAAPPDKAQAENAPPADGPAAPTEASAGTAKPPEKRFGFDKLAFTPALTLGVKSQPAQSNFPTSARPDRPTFTDMNMQGSLKSEVARGGFGSQAQFDFVGASFKNEALRFAQLGDRAPRVDLASYLMQMQTGKAKYQMGHFSFGALRHLMNNFSSRGLMMNVPIAGRGDIALAAMNGSSVVGFGNFFGLDKRRHQLASASLGWEFLPKRPGGLRVEGGMLDGWLQPVNGFSQGSINDAERSRGLAFRVLTSDPTNRFKVEGGFTRSKFVNPQDALLDQNTSVSPFPAVTRNALYVDAAAEVLKDRAVTKTMKANLTLAFRTERVDPLFRSLGASTQADKFANDLSATGTLGDLNVQYTHARFNDNLANIPSILKSLTRANTLTIGAPLASFFSDPQKPSPLWPRVGYTLNRTYQFGAAIPVNGGFEFAPEAIPNQVSNNHSFNADWQIQKLRFGYRFNRSLQDNRQIGLERADLAGLVNGFSAGYAASQALDLGLEINRESADNRGAGAIDRTLRLAPTVNWRMTKKMTFASNFSTTLAGDAARTKRNRNAEFDMQWTYSFGFERDRFRKLTGQFFIRYANRYAFNRNFIDFQRDLQKTQIVNMGLSLNFF